MNWQWRRWLVGFQWFREVEYSLNQVLILWALYFYFGPLRLGGKWTRVWWKGPGK